MCARNRPTEIVFDRQPEPSDTRLNRELLATLTDWQNPASQERAQQLRKQIERRLETAACAECA